MHYKPITSYHEEESNTCKFTPTQQKKMRGRQESDYGSEKVVLAAVDVAHEVPVMMEEFELQDLVIPLETGTSYRPPITSTLMMRTPKGGILNFRKLPFGVKHRRFNTMDLHASW